MRIGGGEKIAAEKEVMEEWWFPSDGEEARPKSREAAGDPDEPSRRVLVRQTLRNVVGVTRLNERTHQPSWNMARR